MHKEISILIYLQNNVVKQFGKQISTATDCDNLARLISQNFNVNLSSQTLRRFFGLIKSKSNSSNFTLDLISKFCGFQDFADFSQFYRKSELEIFFADTENSDKDYWLKSEQLCRQITDSPELLVSTHHRLMAFPLARKYFMENHPQRDLIGTVYAQYFLGFLKFNTNNEAKIFAYGFLFQAAFLVQNQELMTLFYKKVRGTKLTDDVYVIPAGLKFGVQLLYADFTGNENLFRKCYSEMITERLRRIEASKKSVCSFEYTVLESLIFTDRTAEMQFLIENNTLQIDEDQNFIPAQRKKTHKEVWNILCATAYQKMGDKEKTETYFAKVNLDNLEIGWKKYYSILYYFVKLNSSDRIQQTSTVSILRTLINETYFGYYEPFINDYLGG